MWRDAIEGFADDRSKGFEDLQLGHQRNLQGLDFNDLMANQELDDTLTNIISQLLGRRSSVASELSLRGI